MVEKILGLLLGRAGKGAQSNLLGALLPMLVDGGGGGLDLGSILGKLQGGGMGTKVDSWMGSGGNEALSAREARRVIDQSDLEALARSAGVSKRQAADGLGRLLPDMVDKLSPDGKLLEGDELNKGVGDLKAALGF